MLIRNRKEDLGWFPTTRGSRETREGGVAGRGVRPSWPAWATGSGDGSRGELRAARPRDASKRSWRGVASSARSAFETVEIGSLVGSVGRCGAFDAGFLRVCSCSADRWRRVYEAFLEGKALPPVELYKLGAPTSWWTATTGYGWLAPGGGRGRHRDRVRLTALPRGLFAPRRR